MAQASNNTREPSAPECVCAECGHEQIGMDPCRKCGSIRTVLLSVVVREFGENWRDTCFPTEPDKEAP